MTKKMPLSKLVRLQDVLKGHRNMLIVLQDFPDPDAIAAAAALKELARATAGIQTSLGCSGIVGRAENRALVKYMGLNLLKMSNLDLSTFDVVAMVDTQPGTGNNSLPVDAIPDIVIDHHPIRPATRKSPFYDIRRRYGATSTMLYEHLTAAGFPIDIQLATALAYGIRSDTNDLGREATQADIDAFLALYPLSNKRKLGRLDTEQLPREYFGLLHAGLKNALTYGRCVVSRLGVIENPDMIAEVADLLLRNEESTWALCCGSYAGKLLLSLRTLENDADAGKIAKRIVGHRGTGGGHAAMAGGQIPLQNNSPVELSKTAQQVVARFLLALGEAGVEGHPLIRAARVNEPVVTVSPAMNEQRT